MRRQFSRATNAMSIFDRDSIFLFLFYVLQFPCICSVYTYESLSNELWVVMRTDETVSMSGYFAVWEALKVDKCENKTYRGLNSGFIESPGFPNEESSRFHLPLDCWTIIDAPSKYISFKGCQAGLQLAFFLLCSWSSFQLTIVWFCQLRPWIFSPSGFLLLQQAWQPSSPPIVGQLPPPFWPFGWAKGKYCALTLMLQLLSKKSDEEAAGPLQAIYC